MGYIYLALIFLCALGGRGEVSTATLYFLGGVIKGVGKVAKKAAPFAGLIPGVGTLAAAGLGAGGGLLAGEGFKGALSGAAQGAAGGLLGGGIGKLGGISRLGGGLGGAIKGVGGFIGDHPQEVLGGIAALLSARDRSQQRGASQDVLRQQQEALARRRQLEEQALSGLAPIGRRNLSPVFADPSNPFAR